MKYELIKEYPGSPKLETIEWLRSDCNGNTSSKEWRGTHFYNSYPEFWKKVEELDYDILNITDGKSIVSYENGGGVYGPENLNAYKNKDYWLSCFLNCKGTNWKINSVKRLSDGEFFSIGDFVDFKDFGHKGFQKIERFEIDYFDKTRITAYNSAYGIGLDRWEKQPIKQSLFISEDGVQIFEGDTVWHTNMNTNKKPYSSAVNYKKPFTPVRGLFSSKEKAEEWFLLNKPCLSIKEIAPIFGQMHLDNSKNVLDRTTGKLKLLVESKS